MKSKSKHKTPKLLLEVMFTLVVAGILSGLLALLAVIIFKYLAMSGSQLSSYVNYVSGILFGLIVGYKLKALFTEYKK